MRYWSRHIALPLRIVQRLMRGRDIGRMKLGGGGKRLHGCVIAHHEGKYLAEKMRVLGGRTQGFRADSAFGQE